MNKITYTQELLGIMALFDNVTHIPLKDCFVDNSHLLTFVVHAEDVGRAIGRKALYVKKLEHLFKRRVRILGFHNNIQQFVRYLIYPLSVTSVSVENGILKLKNDDRKTKSLLIGRNAQNLRNLEGIVKRYFSEIREIRVE